VITRRALAAWAGTDQISRLAGPANGQRLARLPLTPASRLLALLVAGVEIPAIDGAPAELPGELLEVRGDHVRSRVAVLPTARGVCVCDRWDAPQGDVELVQWPDDSSYHLARAIPTGRRDRWLDLGCGSAFAALERPELATRIVGVEINARAVSYARLGAALSGIAHLDVIEADATVYDGGPFDLVTCNPPIPFVQPSGPRWHAATIDIVRAMIARAGRLVAPGGLVVVHAALEPILAVAGGERIVVAYTPADRAQFGVLWWRPDADERHVVARRPLTMDRPHLEPIDRDAALAGTLAVF
jgi:SAM-dependent methyltransferase